jgi:UDP-N-acetylglucosamine 2-epimerase (non-hydrolysing)
VGRALAELARRLPELQIVLPVHRNPVVREVLLPEVEGLANIAVLEPLPYGEFARLLAASTVVLTDSGGVQEEAPSLGKPVLVMRESTERPEGIAAGTARLVGTSTDVIVTAVESLIRHPAAHRAMARAINPYGDGRAASRTVVALNHFLNSGPAVQEFDPAA